MKECHHSTPEVYSETSENGQTVSIYVGHNPPLLRLQRTLPWESSFAIMTRRWHAAGTNIEGRPGRGWDVSFYGPLVVLMIRKNLKPRDMEAYVAENVVGRVFLGRPDDQRAQIRIIARVPVRRFNRPALRGR